MDLINMEGVEGGADSILDDCAEVIGDYFYGYVDPKKTPETWRKSVGASLEVLNRLRQRGFLTPEAIEQLKREGL